MKKKIGVFLSIMASLHLAVAQPSTSGQIQESYKQRGQLELESKVANYPIRNIGPVVQGGRVTDFAINSKDTKQFYVAYASGGVYKTVNNGITFDPVFDNQGALTIGDIAMAPSNAEVLYVGTGEKNSSRSSYAGNGVYRSNDGGATWAHLGLEETHHISRIMVHPDNPDIVWVAAIGALYTPSEGRGLYVSKDGGKTWEKTLFVNNETGVIDLVVNPKNPNQLFAATWERSRKAWEFKGNGAGSSMYRSDDGGMTWKKIVTGFPQGEFVGRIGLDISSKNPNVLYALLDNQYETKEEKEEKAIAGIKMSSFKDMDKAAFAAIENKSLEEFLRKSNFPKQYTAEVVKAEVASDKYLPKALTEYFGNANSALFSTKIAGAELYKTTNSGDSWEKVNAYNLDGVYFTYGYYFGEVRVDPTDDDILYIFGVPLLKSMDGGKTFERIDGDGVHVDHQALWVNPNDNQHVRLGNDGGYYQSYDQGNNWDHINNVAVGQFYTVNYDMETPYNIYGGLQDNGTNTGSSKSVINKSKQWESLFGGDGMFVAADPRNPDVVFTGFQFGNYYRINRKTNDYKYITPSHNLGEDKLRFNWRTPMMLSSHNADVVYLAAQRLYRSMNQGETWDCISPDLTKNKAQGNVPFSTIASLAESKLKFGLIYAGTDDGNVQVSKNGGATWTKVNNGLPSGKWVSSIHPSEIEEGTVFVTLNGYREDDFRTYVYKSTDYGQTWANIKGNLPDVVVNVVVEDPVKKGLLYLGADHGAYISFDSGKKWALMPAVGNVSAYDMKVHPRELELIIASHGRSMFVMELDRAHKIYDNQEAPLLALKAPDKRKSRAWGNQRYPYSKKNEPSLLFEFYLANKTEGLQVTVKNENGNTIHSATINKEAGIQSYAWDLKGVEVVGKKKSKSKSKVPPPPKYVEKGKYTVEFSSGSTVETLSFEIK